MNPRNLVKSFLEELSLRERPLILALSGGVDSLCLLHLLVENKSLFKELHLAHVDHRLRAESGLDAEKLKNLADHLNLPFHIHVIDKSKLKGNLEDAWRKERIRFFVKLAEEIGAQAVVLGHHADDQAETALKRLFEGAPLVSFQCMKPITMWNEVPFWRPMLKVPKGEIVRLMTHLKAWWLEDSTNADQAYLRARMRHALMPLLSQKFGKNVTPSLCRLANDLDEMSNYVAYVTKPYEPKKVKGPFGSYYDFSANPPKTLFEWKFLIKRICREENFPISHEKLRTAANLLKDDAANKEIQCSKNKFLVDRGKIFFLLNPKGEWKLEMTDAACDKISNWSDIFQGKASAFIPRGDCQVTSAKKEMIYKGSSTLGSWWSKHKIPNCVRYLAPVLMHENELTHEFLTGKCMYIGQQNQRVLLKFKKLCC